VGMSLRLRRSRTRGIRMDEERALLAAIEHKLDDDAPKLIIADYYLERSEHALSSAFRWAVRWGRLPGRTDDSKLPWEWEGVPGEQAKMNAMLGLRTPKSSLPIGVFYALRGYMGESTQTDFRIMKKQFPSLQSAFASLAIALEEEINRIAATR